MQKSTWMPALVFEELPTSRYQYWKFQVSPITTTTEDLLATTGETLVRLDGSGCFGQEALIGMRRRTSAVARTSQEPLLPRSRTAHQRQRRLGLTRAWGR